MLCLWYTTQQRLLLGVGRDVARLPVLSVLFAHCVTKRSSAIIKRAFSTAVEILRAMKNETKPKLFFMFVFINRAAHVLETSLPKAKIKMNFILFVFIKIFMYLDLFYDLKKQSPTQVVWFWGRSMLKNIPEMVEKIIQGAI